MDLIALYLGDLLGTVEKSEYDTISSASWSVCRRRWNRCWQSIEDVKYFASRYFNHDSIFFIGRNLDYAMGLEGSLKLKEISYIHSEAYASGELKHGTISLIEPGTLVVALGTYAPLFDKAMSNVVEVKARGAEVLALTTEALQGEDGAHGRQRQWLCPRPTRWCSPLWAWCPCSCLPIMWLSSAAATLISPGIWPRA